MHSRTAIDTAVNLCLAREREERRLADDASDEGVRDTHFMLAERYADQAWAIAENNDIGFIPSRIWSRCGAPEPTPSPARASDRSPIAI
jgi:hypothetical protein